MKEDKVLKMLEEDDIKVTLLIGRKSDSIVAGSTDGYRYFPFIEKRALSSLGAESQKYIKQMVLEKLQESKKRELETREKLLKEIEEMENRINQIN